MAQCASSAADGRLLWRCRRGMKELDVLLERYVQSHFAAASPQQRLALGQLLELPDPLLADYLFGHATPPEPALAQLAGLIATAPQVCNLRPHNVIDCLNFPKGSGSIQVAARRPPSSQE
ncbi:MAG TPA: succinate dehydrogenase assembly factor 2 [Steroidobacteraceae bacterium]